MPEPYRVQGENEIRWSTLPATEKEQYVKFHKVAYEEDVKHAEKTMLEFPRWSIISGYYAMHDLTKLFLGEKFGVKLSSPEIHRKAIEALEHFVKDAELKKKLLRLLEDAEGVYYSTERLKERTLPALLKRGKQERGRAQYYSEESVSGSDINAKKASYFLQTVVKPYVEIVEKLRE